VKLDPRRSMLTDPATLALQLSAGRTLLAAGLFAAPVSGARVLGMDTATAQRVSWLTRMLAVRDGAIGAGGVLAGRRGGDVATWVLAGAVADAVDAIVIAGALRRGRLSGLPAAGTVAGAGGAAVVGAVTAWRTRRRS
jgi:hypothetical protein